MHLRAAQRKRKSLRRIRQIGLVESKQRIRLPVTDEWIQSPDMIHTIRGVYPMPDSRNQAARSLSTRTSSRNGWTNTSATPWKMPEFAFLFELICGQGGGSGSGPFLRQPCIFGDSIGEDLNSRSRADKIAKSGISSNLKEIIATTTQATTINSKALKRHTPHPFRLMIQEYFQYDRERITSGNIRFRRCLVRRMDDI